ncbi:RNA polymerase sigma factor [Marinicella pacifica]|uniref:RNA polymerase sigma factor n=2 Tax=Marinicella pacifica TaxID=1171543 RepID=A0A917CPB7_9GAMM|nr:RNA polymerase sigma factor [Marinicella pacifica]
MLVSFYNNNMLKRVNRETIDNLNNEQLMVLYANNKNNAQRAFAVLYERHKGPLYRFVLKSINNEAQTDELFQDLWFRIIQHKDSFNPKQKFTTWAYTIARRLLIDFYRKQGKRFEQAFDEAMPEHNEEPTGSYALPEQVLQQKRHARALQQAVTELPPEQREVFLLFHEGDLSLQQIADITDQPKERIKSRYRYAVKKLKNTLQVLL